jgi:uncharacterized phage protein gp47/JayE
MATLQPRSFSAIVQMIAAGVQGRSKVVLDYSIGSTLRAIAEGHAGVALWIQGLILKLLLTTRAATSTGADLDTWVNDFGLYRLGATPATGSVNFIRFTGSASTPFIPVGATMETADGTQDFVVVADSSNALFSPSLNGYTMPAFVTSITVPVQSLASGYATNALAGTVTVLTTNVSGIDQIINASAFTGGIDSETDSALRVRFQAYIASLSKATVAAITYAVNSLHFGVQCTVTENQNYDGSTRLGYFYVVVDDGSGTPSDALVTAAAAAIEIVRPLTVMYAVFKPVIIQVTVSMTIVSNTGFDHNTVIANVGEAVRTYINTLPLGQSLSYAKVMQVAFDADAGVKTITGYTLNGGVTDIAATNQNVVKTSVVSVV